MSKCYERNNVVGGLFKVRGETVEGVIDCVGQWKHGSDGKRFERLSVRGCTGKTERDSMVAIEFLYVFGEENLDDSEQLRLHNVFFHKYTDLLRRSFGNGLAVWDISTPVYEIVD
ncbi:MAG: hypothetical protein WAV21_01295 [Minisyncoccia bacterium]